MKDLMRLLSDLKLSPVPGTEVPRGPVPPIPPDMGYDPDSYEPWDPETDEEDDPACVDENGVCIADPSRLQDPDAEDRKHVIH
ncbi:MAG: hypothetical protein M0003_07735 [Acidithiobacillus sp.]|nr:hypothetical protein [Acidithiobacillus sp.]